MLLLLVAVCLVALIICGLKPATSAHLTNPSVSNNESSSVRIMTFSSWCFRLLLFISRSISSSAYSIVYTLLLSSSSSSSALLTFALSLLVLLLLLLVAAVVGGGSSRPASMRYARNCCLKPDISDRTYTHTTR